MRCARQIPVAVMALVASCAVMSLASAAAWAKLSFPQIAQFSETSYGSIAAPGGVAVDAGGNTYVTDFFASDSGGPNGVDRFDPAGVFQSEITGPPGTPYSTLGFAPRGVAVTSGGDIYVAGGERDPMVDRYDSGGVYQSGLTGVPGGEFVNPARVAVDSAGKLYVLDEGVATVYKFSSSGVYEEEIGSTPSGSLNGAFGIAIDASDNLYVSTRDGLEEFDSTGVFVKQMSLTGPAGPVAGDLAIGSGGNIYLLDGGTFEFGPGGEYLGQIEVENQPVDGNGIAVSPSGDIYVVTQGPGVRVFGPGVLVPDVATGIATNLEIGSTAPTLAGTINPDGVDAHFYFEYGLTASYGDRSPAEPGADAGSGESPVEASIGVSGLLPNSTYHYRLDGVNANGISHGEDATFTTRVLPVTNDQAPVASHVTIDGEALLSGVVNPENLPTTYHFVYGATSGYGIRTPDEIEAGSGIGDVAVSEGLEDLKPGSTYHFALVATNAIGSTRSEDETFTTPPATPPTATTGVAEGVTHATATLSGTVDPDGLPTVYTFEYGTTASYGTSVFGSAGSSAGAATFTVSVQGLAFGSTYHYRLVAVNQDGTGYGEDRTFTTVGFPNPFNVPAPPPFIHAPSVAFPSEAPARAKPKHKKKTVKSKRRKGHRQGRGKRTSKAKKR